MTCSTFNMSIDTDPQLQEAASPQVGVVRSFLRYAKEPVLWKKYLTQKYGFLDENI